MTIQDKIDAIEAGTDYVPNSLVVKSFDERGCTFKWLEKNIYDTADRKQNFIELNPDEKDKSLPLRTAVNEIMISEPQ